MMSHTNFNIELYLKRINYKSDLSASLDTLFRLHNAQIFNIPFENLDIHLGKPILLDRESLFNKIVMNGRGGYCYELNGLFLNVLQEIGFKVEAHLARTMLGYDTIRPKTHQISSVWLEGERWLVDLGFGSNSLISPLKYELNVEVKQFSETYRILHDEYRENILQICTPDGWLSLYSFNFEKQLPVDYFLPNYFNSTSKDSIFPKMRICNIATPVGRILLNDMEFKIRDNGKITTKIIKSNNDYLEHLKKYFHLTFPLDTVFKSPLEI